MEPVKYKENSILSELRDYYVIWDILFGIYTMQESIQMFELTRKNTDRFIEQECAKEKFERYFIKKFD